ncbi:MAG: superoxide dismutase family protein [Actinomycetota bacterium]|jgi:Cu-Zn family superoxide dismutase|nr:superoxide dismutase family protein [Actinomycetota bacterium]
MTSRSRRTPLAACGLAVLAVGLVACGSGGVEQSGTLAPPPEAEGTYTYDQTAAPAGAELTVASSATDGGTRVELTVDGLAPNRTYGVHAHVNPCGETGDAAGPHFQNVQDPVSPSVDPAYANPRNEIWLDVRTDADGAGSATTEVPFDFAGRAPASVVLHETPTSIAAGEAGTAGGRLACLTVPFGT